MPNKLVSFSLLWFSLTLSGWVLSQTNRIYTMPEALIAPVDSVFQLTLSKSKLTEIPDDLFRFKNLQYLDLSKNKLTKIPLELKTLSALTHLNLSKNKLDAFPTVLCAMSQISMLDLSENALGSLPNCIQYLVNIKELDLFQTALDNLPNELALLTQIEKMDLRGINFSKPFQEKWIDNLPNTIIQFDSPCNCLEK